MYREGTVRRAFAIAAECTSVDAVRARLKEEGYSGVDLHLESRLLRRDLTAKLLGKAKIEPQQGEASAQR